jgi:hypothetical protein
VRWRLPAIASTLILGACAFPDVTYINGAAPDGTSPFESSTGPDSPATGEGGDASPEMDSTTDSPGRETSTTDAPPPADAYVFEAAADAPPCDQDEDGYLAIGSCGGNDCDDHDPRAYPMEPNYLTALPSAATMYGDWNCNHVVEKLFPSKVNCTTALGTCDQVIGFTGDPGCGTAGTFVQCMTMNVVFCVVGASSTQLQACK